MAQLALQPQKMEGDQLFQNCAFIGEATYTRLTGIGGPEPVYLQANGVVMLVKPFTGCTDNNILLNKKMRDFGRFETISASLFSLYTPVEEDMLRQVSLSIYPLKSMDDIDTDELVGIVRTALDTRYLHPGASYYIRFHSISLELVPL